MLDWITTHATVLFDETLGLFVDPRQRVFWPCLVTSALVAAIALAIARRGRPDKLRFVVRFLFDRRVWLHPSSLLDLRLLVANVVIRALLVAPLGLSAYALALALVGGLDGWLGVPTPSTLSPTTVTALYTVVLFVAWDFSRYFLHRLAHEVPFLWELHKVHHSAQVMTPLTLFRVHPVERFLFGLRGVLVTGVVTGIFFYVFRERAVQAELLGVNVLGLAFNALGSNLRHSHVWVSYGPWLERIFMSPAQHQIHHSVEPAHYGSNYGVWLSVWDWLGGSLRVTRLEREPLRFGLEGEDLNHDPHGLASSILEPLATAPRRLRRIAAAPSQDGSP